MAVVGVKAQAPREGLKRSGVAVQLHLEHPQAVNQEARVLESDSRMQLYKRIVRYRYPRAYQGTGASKELLHNVYDILKSISGSEFQSTFTARCARPLSHRLHRRPEHSGAAGIGLRCRRPFSSRRLAGLRWLPLTRLQPSQRRKKQTQRWQPPRKRSRRW